MRLELNGSGSNAGGCLGVIVLNLLIIGGMFALMLLASGQIFGG